MTRHPDWAPTAGVETARCRAAMLANARRFFSERGVLEVDTPALSLAAPSEPQVEPVTAQLQLRPNVDYFLQTSPEFCMKRLLCAGYPDIYQVCKVFRDNEAGRMHQPEFTMVEWYRLGLDFDAIVDESLQMIDATLGQQIRLAPALRIDYRQAFQDAAGVDPINCRIDQLQSLADADADLINALGPHRDSWLDLVLDTHVAPSFARDRLTALCHYPSTQAALAKLNPSDSAVAERFEIFYGRSELANGYVELADAAELRRRVKSDNARRRALKLRIRPVDQQFAAAMEQGLPTCAGVAAGFDRMLMIAVGAEDIRDVQSFAFKEHDNSEN